MFKRKCAVCGCALPEKRKKKDVCDLCAIQYRIASEQFRETAVLSDNAKNPLVGFDRCLFGLALLSELRPFVEAGLVKYGRGLSREGWISHFVERADAFRKEIAVKNEKRKYEKKIGLPDISHWKNVLENRQGKSGGLIDGCCKGCWEAEELNGAGYCHNCLRRATMASQDEFDEFSSSGAADGLSGDGLIIALLDWKLEKSR